MDKIYQHITDPPTFMVSNNRVIENVCIEATGSSIGRILFTEHSPMIDIQAGESCLIRNCVFIGPQTYGGTK